MIKLGDKVKDNVTGFQGIAIARHSYLNGCDHISVQPPVDKEGKVPEYVTFDEPMLIVVKEKEVKKEPDKTKGGPSLFPPKKRD